MLYRDRKPIDYPTKTAKYRALKIDDNPRFLAKIAKLTARKNAWWAVLKAVNRFENFKDSEDDTPALVSKQFEHVVNKYHTLTTVRDEVVAEETKGENKENEGENKDKQSAARD